MLEPIKINSTDAVVIPLFDMQHKETLRSYRKSVHRQIQSKRGLYPIGEVVFFLQWATLTNFFDRGSVADICRFVGYEFGLTHGGILTVEGTLRADVPTLVALEDNQDAISGYKAGRQWFFEEATSDERIMSDDQLIERLRDLTKDAPNWHNPEGVWFFTVGCLFGELSGNPFPLTDQERRQWEAETEAARREYLDGCERDQQNSTRDSKQVMPVTYR